MKMIVYGDVEINKAIYRFQNAEILEFKNIFLGSFKFVIVEINQSSNFEGAELVLQQIFF